jgi:protein-S-isoprenylcysteine O-methyltransferase Ste14
MTKFERLFVWLGGAVFVIALGASVYRYLVSWAVSAVPGAGGLGAVSSVAGDTALLTVFATHHSLFARDAVKGRVERLVPRRLLRSSYVWTASLLLLAVLILWAPVGGDMYQVSGIGAMALALVQLSGVILIARSVATIDPLDLAGIRARSRHEALQVSGPYRIVRHPLSLGWVLALFGAAHMTGDRLTFAVVTTVYLAIAVPWEERSLVATFGADYVRYQRMVPWRIVPYVY